MVCGCQAIIQENDPRAELWMSIFGKLSFPLKHPVLMNMGDVVGIGYEGDASALTSEQRERLIRAMMKKFMVSRREIEETLKDGVIPIKAENVTVSICNLHFRCMI